MKTFIFITKATVKVKATNEEDARQKFWEEVEGQPQQNACDWINDHTEVKEEK